MLGAIVLAGCTLPDRTPLKTFLIASAIIFLLGNVLVFRAPSRNPKSSTPGDGAWPHILRALAILAFSWLIILVLFRL